eukprot:7009544-Lingulodinium_polyedra.AAC.1
MSTRCQPNVNRTGVSKNKHSTRSRTITIPAKTVQDNDRHNETNKTQTTPASQPNSIDNMAETR